MGMLEEIIARLESKKFGNVTLYFGKDSKYVKLMEQDGKYIYVVASTEADGKIVHRLKTELRPHMCINYEVKLKGTWVIPDIESIDRVEEVKFAGITDDVSEMLSDKIYHIIHYGILQDEKFNGSNFSNSLVMVLVENARGKRYLVPYLVANGVHGCDEELDGGIMGQAFRFETLGSSDRENVLYIENLL